MAAVAEKLAMGCDYAQTSALPFGMNSFGYARRFLAEAVSPHTGSVLETGWGRIFAHRKPATVSYDNLPQDDRLRFTLDYPDDLRFFRALIEALGTSVESASDSEVIQLVLDRHLYDLNAALAQEYWANFRRQVEGEKAKLHRAPAQNL
jgi:spore coat polysaccharide biosynthesis protein SpsF (cytidylyltransferase family)